MNGMIFAAGLGTRLKPLTNDRPKALVELNGHPLLWHVMQRMQRAGVERVVVNVHHFATQVIDYLSATPFETEVLISDERDALLDTGGGLRKAVPLFRPGEPVLVHNVDIVTDLELKGLLAAHAAADAHATLVVRPGGSGRVLRFNEAGRLTGWENTRTGEQKPARPGFEESSRFSFAGIHVLSPAYWSRLYHTGAFSIIDEHLLHARDHNIRSFVYEGSVTDAGTPEALRELAERGRAE